MGERRRGRPQGRSRQPNGRIAFAALVLAVVAVIALTSGAALAYWQDTHADEGAADRAVGSPAVTAQPEPSPSRSKGSKGTRFSASPEPEPIPMPTHSKAKPSTVPVPAAGLGTFRTAQADGSAVGQGSRVRRYKVLVEDGIAMDSLTAATEVAAILADRRGWTHDGVNSFRLVSTGSYDFVVKIATPGTVDTICGAAGLLTRGEVNCSVGSDVVVNLKRWVLGSPEFAGPIDEYRALIVNHEVGHRIGHGHETCPGPGKPAPAMMQQIKGLKGCVSNAWPYTIAGSYLGGPSVP